MNQAIQFTDRMTFNSTTQQIIFFAQVNGLLVECVVATDTLAICNDEQAKEYFERHRFDFEEQAEHLIDEECFSSAGQIELTL